MVERKMAFRKLYKQSALKRDFQKYELTKGTGGKQPMVSSCCGFCPEQGGAQPHTLLRCVDSTYPSCTFHFMETPSKALPL